MNSISVITPNYPTSRFREHGAFVEELVGQWEDMGVDVEVVAPIPVSTVVRGIRNATSPVPIKGCNILSPHYLTFSGRRIGVIDLGRWSRTRFMRASVKARRGKPSVDAYYGKFLLTGGAAAASLGRTDSRPAFADLGESRLLETLTETDRRQARQILQSLHGIVCVSERLKEEAVALGADPGRILMLPNVASQRFVPMDKAACRRRLGLPQDKLLAIFVGHLIERKGPLRVLAALEQMKEEALGIFIGRGQQKPSGSKVVHCGPVPNIELPFWLNAADVMVLPTLAEGSCNALCEALACGLPAITSDIPDIRYQFRGLGVVLVDPMNVEQIANALDHHAQQLSRPDTKISSARPRRASRGATILEWMSSL